MRSRAAAYAKETGRSSVKRSQALARVLAACDWGATVLSRLALCIPSSLLSPDQG